MWAGNCAPRDIWLFLPLGGTKTSWKHWTVCCIMTTFTLHTVIWTIIHLQMLISAALSQHNALKSRPQDSVLHWCRLSVSNCIWHVCTSTSPGPHSLPLRLGLLLFSKCRCHRLILSTVAQAKRYTDQFRSCTVPQDEILFTARQHKNI